MEINTTYVARAYFKTAIFNDIVREYEQSLLVTLMQKYLLCSAKGSSVFQEYTDMPYHVHILNGLYPSLLLLEEILQHDQIIEKSKGTNEQKLKDYLKCFIVGFTLHDLNKLTDRESLKEAVKKDLEEVCTELTVTNFFKNWKQYLEEIKFIIFKTEERTKSLALNLNLKDRPFFNKYFSDVCQFADALSFSRHYQNIKSTRDVYNAVNRVEFKRIYENVDRVWQLSYVEINDNIYTLLSQKLLNISRQLIYFEKQQNILFNLRNGIIYFGKPLAERDIEVVKERFQKSLSDDSDPIVSTKIDEQQCSFGFLDSQPLTKDILFRVVQEKWRRLFAINQREYFEKNHELKGFIQKFFDEKNIPLNLMEFEVKKQKRIGLSLKDKEWLDLDKDDQNLLLTSGLQKIKFLSSKKNSKWKKELIKYQEELSQKLNDKEIKKPKRTMKTLAALYSAVKLLKSKNADEVINEQVEEIKATLSISDTVSPITSASEFIDMNLAGNFNRSIPDFAISNIPKKSEMCVICGNNASIIYEDTKSFGLKPRGFNNKCVNTLRNSVVKICELCYHEMMLRQSLFGSITSDPYVCTYYGFGEYFINMDIKSTLNILQKAKGLKIEESGIGFNIFIEKTSINYNLYSMVFDKVTDDTKSQFYFLRRLLQIIQKTGFKIYCTDLITPYHFHNEMLVFDNCMPFIKHLGWDSIRIDKIESVLDEMNLLLSFNPKLITAHVLEYTEDKKALFSFYYELDKKDRKIVRNNLTHFANNQKEVLSMTVMEKLADIALQMTRPRPDSSSEESWIFRDAVEVLKISVKEGRDRANIIQQVAGELRSTLKRREYADESKAEVFAETLHDELYKKEWGERLPQPGRLKNWRNQFAFLYSKKNLEDANKAIILNAIELLKKNNKEIKWDGVWKQILTERPQVKKYEDEYYQVYKQNFTNLSKEASK